MGVIGINVKEDGNSTGNAGKREIIALSPPPPPRPSLRYCCKLRSVKNNETTCKARGGGQGSRNLHSEIV